MRGISAWAAAMMMLASASAAQTPAPAAPKLPTARELYVSCFLLLKEDFAAGVGRQHKPETCAGFALIGIATREGRAADNKYRFCLPKDDFGRDDTTESMAAAYIEYYDRQARVLPQDKAREAFTMAMIEKWPCE